MSSVQYSLIKFFGFLIMRRNLHCNAFKNFSHFIFNDFFLLNVDLDTNSLWSMRCSRKCFEFNTLKKMITATPQGKILSELRWIFCIDWIFLLVDIKMNWILDVRNSDNFNYFNENSMRLPIYKIGLDSNIPFHFYFYNFFFNYFDEDHKG